MERLAVLASGGLDSAVLLADLGRENIVFPVYVEAGLAWEEREKRALTAYLDALDLPNVQPLTVLEMPVRSLYGKHWSTTGEDVPGYEAPDEAVYLPGRNVLLIGVTAVWCALNDVSGIAIGSLDDNPFRTRGFPHVLYGGLIDWGIGASRVYINVENLGDVRQTREDPLVMPVRGVDGRWTVDAWAPLEGRTLNAGVRWRF